MPKQAKWGLAALVLLLGAGGGGWYLLNQSQGEELDPEVAEVKQIVEQEIVPQMQQAFESKPEEQPKKTPEQQQAEDAERIKQFEELRKKTENFSEAQKNQMGDVMMKIMLGMMTKTASEYHSLPENQKQAFLDQQIDRMTAMRKTMRRPQDNNGNNQANNNNNGGPFGPGRNRNGTKEQQEQWRRKWLDNTSPAERAQLEQFFSDMRARAEERGLPTQGPRG